MSTPTTWGSRRLRVAAVLTGTGALAAIAAGASLANESEPIPAAAEAPADEQPTTVETRSLEEQVVTSAPLSDRIQIEMSPDEPAEPEVQAAEVAEPEPAPEPEPTTEPEPARTVWDQLADCEAGEWTGDGGFVTDSADWSATAGMFEGGLQFHPDTWDGYKLDGMPEAAYDATRDQQIAVAERVLADQGWKAWPVCSRKLGLR